MTNGASKENKRLELLAPAGGWEQLEYALRFGADAVYLACEKFGMRSRACNFPLDQLSQVVAYAHQHDAKVHVACNIVMHQQDIEELPLYLESVQKAGADALILGDLGALRLAREYAPQVQIHVSTQASVSNAQTALTWYELGARRIVCAREMSLESIAAMHKQLPEDLELEAFVHGAMCMAYSGRCLISDFTTGRSALQGNCAQSCRWHYDLVEEKRPGEYFGIEEDENGSYLLNAQDLNMIAYLEQLAQAGIDSIKIEGRNKKAYYVATVVNAYRQALDGADPKQMAEELEKVSHRPYSTGFYFGPAHQTHGSIDYLRGWEWAAQVLSCSQAQDGWWECRVRCRNRFSPQQTMEVVSPGELPRTLHVKEIRFQPAESEAYPSDIANRTNEDYLLLADSPLLENDIIRVLKQ